MMKIHILLILTLIVLYTSCVDNQEDIKQTEKWTQYIEPRIGTAHYRWFHFTLGVLPFGLAKPAPSTKGTVTDKIGLSYISIENTRINMQVEAVNKAFNKVKKQVRHIWNEYWGHIKVETNIEDDKAKFYIGLYQALLGRGLANDVNGAYPQNDGSRGQLPMLGGKPQYNIYNTDAIWGAQWNLSQPWVLACPEYMSEFISSHLQFYKDTGWLADSLANNRYASGVGTNLFSTIIVEAYQYGISDFDTELAYETRFKKELDGKENPLGAEKINTTIFRKYGYVPHRNQGKGYHETFMLSASHSLEYSYSAAWVIVQCTKRLGDKVNYDKLMYLPKGWEHLYDQSCNFIRPKKSDGHSINQFNPMEVWRGVQEENTWQYTFYAPHDIKGSVEKTGKKMFTMRLNRIFTQSPKKIISRETEVGAFTDLETLYNHGNQPYLHISWLFNEIRRPKPIQKWVPS